MKYFAYGSNMLTTRLHARVSSASCPIPVPLAGYQLHFHKRSTDCSGKCNIFRSGKLTDVVCGVIFEVDKRQVPDLDQHEGIGYGYAKEQSHFSVGGVEHNVLMYVADADYIDDSLMPYKWYFDLVVAGAEEHSLPPEYVCTLRSQRFTIDPNPARKTRLEALNALEKHSTVKEETESHRSQGI